MRKYFTLSIKNAGLFALALLVLTSCSKVDISASRMKNKQHNAVLPEETASFEAKTSSVYTQAQSAKENTLAEEQVIAPKKQKQAEKHTVKPNLAEKMAFKMVERKLEKASEKLSKKSPESMDAVKRSNMDENLRMALIFAVIAVILAVLGGIVWILWYLSAIAWIIALVFLIMWLMTL